MDNEAVVRGFAKLEALIEQQGKDAREQATNTAKALAVMESKVETLNASQLRTGQEVVDVKMKQDHLANEQARDARALQDHMQHDENVTAAIRLHMERTSGEVTEIKAKLATINTSTNEQTSELGRQTSMLKRIDRTAIVVAVVSTIGAVLAAYVTHQSGAQTTPQTPAQHIQQP